ncbi:uncharacterized protein B0I36DRAFT_354777 [Microdochium trichocladiopsis]|uniref:N-acetyltransferase domain-containing protein n=1 Tax=Microdochium trichocladiopsis TaxID=1682393 RepID=A0A9P8XUT9_9PEZI|nr:uncharacterized protein B0I36DRAFT_354777 [Microdochium trichocladiopsis]KAH7018503.1 hypothetical protein B0I36DRAFT_354777 [Microdochium trichocladiopsis]
MPERVERAVEVLTPEFYDDAVFKYLLCHLTNEKERNKLLHGLMRVLVKVAVLEHGAVLEVSNWGAAAVLCPPGTKLDSPVSLVRAKAVPFMLKIGAKNIPRLFTQPEAAEKFKQTVLTREEKKRVWYCFIIATASDRRRQGLASKLLQEMQRLAVADGNRCLWLEASSAAARKTYEKQGFVAVGEMKFGQGLVDGKGDLDKHGEGVVSWPMVWRPPKVALSA